VIVYLSADGVLNALGWSQVARLLMGLAKQGLHYHLVSMERPDRLADSAARRRAAHDLASAGVEWTPITYSTSGGPAMATNLARLAAAAALIVPRGGLVHARGYHGAACARLLRARRVRYVFDARGYWIDERLDAGRLFTRPAVLATARAVERRLYRDAAAVVTLTELQADDVRRGELGRYDGPVLTIPTCADFDAFRLREDGAAEPPHPELGGPCVLGLVGSINASYHMTEAVRLARRVLELSPDAKLVVLSEQREAFRALCEAEGVPATRTLVETVPHARVPRWTPWLDWGLQLLVTRRSKRASMPTKLAEFFASGVRPVHHGCNDEVGRWVERAGSGVVLRDLSEGSLEEAARSIASITARPRDVAALRRARAVAEPHFSLTSGIARYASLVQELS
jgi:hypothetical protein